MKKTNLIQFSVLLALLVFVTSCGQKNGTNDSKDNLTKTQKDKNGYSYETVKGDILKARIYTLDNGLKVYLTDNKDAPRMQTMIAVRAGSSYDPKETTGLAHYLEHMVFKGTSKIASLDWEKEKPLLQEISDLYEAHKNESDDTKKKLIYAKIDSVSGLAAKYVAANEYDKMITSIGAKGTNAFTSHEMTVYINDIPSNEIDRWLTVESERFSELTLRLFHTELEAVYEEFNMGQDNDYRKSNKALMSGLFKKHPYGTQTTIGEQEHIKNPSLKNIHEYWSTYYVPNNMAVILSGDLDFENTIKSVDQYFGKFKSKDVPKSVRPNEDPITAPIIKEVLGPDAESLSLAFRFDAGDNSSEQMHVDLIDNILTNGQAGLIDLNLTQKQKVLRAGSYSYFLREYGMHSFYGTPREGQTLEEVTELILAEIDKLKKGEFEDWMLEAVLNNKKLRAIKSAEQNNGRCFMLLNSFINNIKWEKYVTYNDELAKITKEDLVEFANKHYKNNYVVVYKRTGEDTTATKVEKPAITPIEINRDVQSKFAEDFFAKTAGTLSPMFLDFKKDIKSGKTKSGIVISSIENTENDLFELNYIIEMGKDHLPELPIAINYLPYLGTDKYTSEQLQQEFYKLGISMNVYSGTRRSYVFISGLQSSMEKGVELFEHVLANVKPDTAAYRKYVAGVLKGRQNQRLNKNRVMHGALKNFGKYGAKNSTTSKLSSKELTAMNPATLTNLLKEIYSYEHSLFYYGKADLATVTKTVDKFHTISGNLREVPAVAEYVEQETDKGLIYFVDYDMVQNWVMLISKGDKFNKETIPNAQLFGEFYGSGLSSVIFQEIRESKALAYSAYSSYRIPRYANESNYLTAFVATQADKMPTALSALKELLNEMPEANKQFELAKEGIIKKIESERITKSSIFWTYMSYKDKGIDYDMRKDTYKHAKETSMDDFKIFFDSKIKDKKFTLLVMGNKKTTNLAALRKLGTVKELTLDQIFGE